MSDDLELIEKSISSPIFIRLAAAGERRIDRKRQHRRTGDHDQAATSLQPAGGAMLQLLQGEQQSRGRQTKERIVQRWVREYETAMSLHATFRKDGLPRGGKRKTGAATAR
jgi:hypothetical protein